MASITSLCVFTGSSVGFHPDHAASVSALGRALAARGLRLIYGGGRVGLMGVLADAVIDAGGEAVGVIPRFLEAKEVAHSRLTHLHVVDTMHARKALMAELSDGFIMLPGGWGTFDEMFEILTWAQLGLHQKPCGMLNVRGYYDGLLAFMEHSVTEGFVNPRCRQFLAVATEPVALLDALAVFTPPVIDKVADAKG